MVILYRIMDTGSSFGMINRDNVYLWRSSLMGAVPAYLIYEDQMGVPFTIEEFLGVFEAYNLAIQPFQIVGYIIGFMAIA